MDMEMSISIDLEKYGAEGEIILSAPGLRRMTELKNEMSKPARVSKKGAEVSVSEVQQGDVEILSILVYVQSAPFERNVESFLSFCDRLAGIKRGNDNLLYDEMIDAVRRIDSGEVASPLDGSPGAGTVSSE